MRKLNTKAGNRELFSCGAGLTQVAITPQGELKPCLMLDSPRYKILPKGLKHAWRKIKRSVSKIAPDEKFACRKCDLWIYCKWCPAQSWLYNKTHTSCVPDLRKQARSIKSKKS